MRLEVEGLDLLHYPAGQLFLLLLLILHQMLLLQMTPPLSYF